MIPRLIALGITLAFFLCALAASEHSKPNAGLPLANADWPVCVTITPGPLKPPKRPVLIPRASEWS